MTPDFAEGSRDQKTIIRYTFLGVCHEWIDVWTH